MAQRCGTDRPTILPLDLIHINMELSMNRIDPSVPANMQHVLATLGEDKFKYYLTFKNYETGTPDVSVLQLRVRPEYIQDIRAASQAITDQADHRATRQHCAAYIDHVTSSVDSTEAAIYRAALQRHGAADKLFTPAHDMIVHRLATAAALSDDDMDTIRTTMSSILTQEDVKALNRRAEEHALETRRQAERMAAVRARMAATAHRKRQLKEDKWLKSHPEYNYGGLKKGFLL